MGRGGWPESGTGLQFSKIDDRRGAENIEHDRSTDSRCHARGGLVRLCEVLRTTLWSGSHRTRNGGREQVLFLVHASAVAY